MAGCKKNRRPKGTGSIQEIIKDKLYLLRWDVPAPSGQRWQKSQRFHGTKKEAEKRLREILREIDEGRHLKTEKDVTLQAYIEDWLKIHPRNRRLRESTVEGYRSLLLQHVIPKLGQYRLYDLQPYHFERLYAELLDHGRKRGEGGLSVRTVQYVHSLLFMIFRHAVRVSKILSGSPVIEEIRPRDNDEVFNEDFEKPTDQVAVLNRAEIKLFLGKNHNDRFIELYRVVLGTGLRVSEVLALKWSDIDFEAKTIRITKQIIRKKGEGLKFGPPKTRASVRVVDIDDDVIAALKRQRQKQAHERLRAGDAYQDEGLVFATELGGKFDPDRLVQRYFKPALRRAGLWVANLPHVGLHLLRHTHASLLVAAGVDVKKVAQRLGHKDAGFTLRIYVKTVHDLKNEVSEKFHRYMQEEKAGNEAATSPGEGDCALIVHSDR